MANVDRPDDWTRVFAVVTDVTATYLADGTIYTNSAKSPYFFSLMGNFVSTASSFDVTVAGVTVASFTLSSNDRIAESCAFIVPSGATFAITKTGGNATHALSRWSYGD